MRHSLVGRAIASLLIALLATSCGTAATTGSDTATTPDTGTTPDTAVTPDAGPAPVDAVSPIDSATTADASDASDAVGDASELTLTVEELLEQQLIQYDIQKMKPTADGSDYGVRTAKKDGRATFYSPKLKAVFDVSAGTDDKAKPKGIGGVRVSVKAEDKDHIFVLVTDPTGQYEPAVYTGALVNGSVEVQSSTSGGDEAPFVYDSKAGNPFEVDKDGTLIGTLATMAVQCVLRTSPWAPSPSRSRSWSPASAAWSCPCTPTPAPSSLR